MCCIGLLWASQRRFEGGLALPDGKGVKNGDVVAFNVSGGPIMLQFS